MTVLRGQRGQALLLLVGALAAAAVGAFVLGAVARGVGKQGASQRAADLAALAGARAMHASYDRLFEPALIGDRPNPRHLEKAAYLELGRTAAERTAGLNGASSVSISFPDSATFAPVRIRAAVSDPAVVKAGGRSREVGLRASAEAELSPPGGGLSGWASGGAYTGPLAYRQGKPMRPDVAIAFDRMAAAAAAAGVSLVINSGYRSDAEQAILFNRHPDPRWVAPPGKSLHRLGTELDLGPPSAYGWLAANAGRFGFVKRYSWEPWHYGAQYIIIAPMALPWLGYTRVSHVGGRTGDRFHSPDEQQEAIRGWAKARGETVTMLPSELDESGGRADRPILTAAIEQVERGEARGVVVAYQSRASRDLRLLLQMWDRVEAAGGEIVSVRENIDTRTPEGRLMRNVYGSFDQHELDRHREDFEKVRRSATERGIWQRRQTPRGYRRDDATRRLVPDEQADAVREAFRARAGGATISSIAGRLRMTTSGVRQMLANRVYLGELRVGDYVNETAHDPLVDEELFEMAQRSVSRPARSNRESALLAGLARCAGCGHLLTRGGRSSHPTYNCPRNHSGGQCPEPTSVTVDVLDRYVEKIALVELARVSMAASEGRGAEQARARLAEAERELAAYLGAVSAADLGAEAFAQGARIRRAAVEVARDELNTHLAQRSVIPAGMSGAEAWKELNVQERNALLRALLAAVVVKRAGGRGARIPLHERVRVLAHGTAVALPERRGGEAGGIVPISLPDVGDPGVLRPPGSQDPLKRPRRVRQVRRSTAVAA